MTAKVLRIFRFAFALSVLWNVCRGLDRNVLFPMSATELKFSENCQQIFDSRQNKTGKIEAAVYFPVVPNANYVNSADNDSGQVQCRYEFYGASDERVQIKFLDFNIPTESKNSTECNQNNSLQLLSQVRGKFEIEELFCGAFLPIPIMSKGPKMFLQFLGKYPNSVSKVGFYGFKAEYRFLTNFGITTGHQVGNNCTFSYNSTERKSGWIASPNFPGLYPFDIVCNYLFYGEYDEMIILRFTYFNVEGIGTCDYLTASDFVEFSNFMSTDRKYAKYCGQREKLEMRSDGKFFRVTFFSNDRFDKTGFRAIYNFEKKNTPVENTSLQSYLSSSATKLFHRWIKPTVTSVLLVIKLRWHF